MKALARGFLAGFGFALGASVAGTLIGYGLGKLGEASVKRLLSPGRTSSPAPSSSPASSEQPDSGKTPETICDEHKMKYFYSGYDAGYGEGLAMGSGVDTRPIDPMGSTLCGVPHSSTEPHKSHYGVPVDTQDDTVLPS